MNSWYLPLGTNKILCVFFASDYWCNIPSGKVIHKLNRTNQMWLPMWKRYLKHRIVKCFKNTQKITEHITKWFCSQSKITQTYFYKIYKFLCTSRAWIIKTSPLKQLVAAPLVANYTSLRSFQMVSIYHTNIKLLNYSLT